MLVLVVGVVVIFESFLISLDALAVFNNRLNAQWFFEEKIWQIQSRLNDPAGAFLPLESSGVIRLGAEEYAWKSTLQLVNPVQELYRVSLDLNWQQGNKRMKLNTQTMANRYFDNSTP